MKIILVDEKDNVIGSKERSKLNHPEDIYRVSALWITNNKGDILLAQRALTKDKDPGLWGPSVAGTVELGETYDDNIKKEISEEIGLKNVKLKKGPKIMVSSPRRYFCKWYFLKTDKKAEDFTIQKEEVAQVKWFSKEKLMKMLKETPSQIIPAFRDGKTINQLESEQ